MCGGKEVVETLGKFLPESERPDAGVFASVSEAAGNSLMFAMTEFALRQATGVTFENPIELQEAILPAVHEYGRRITGKSDLRLTFALNALVGVDFAAWLLYARENGIDTFDALIPEAYRPALGHRHARLASIPLMAYGIPLEEIETAVRDGYFFLKIKIGAESGGIENDDFH